MMRLIGFLFFACTLPACAVSTITLTPSPAASGAVGQRIVLATTITNLPNARYRFEVRDAGNVATYTRDWSTARSTWWYPTAEGSYTARALARSGNAGAPIETSITYTVKPKLSAVSLAATVGAVTAVNTRLTLTATATGGGTVEYRPIIGYRAGTTGTITWDQTRPYGTGRATTFTPDSIGYYFLRVYAREKGSSAYYDVASPDTKFTTKAAISGFDVVFGPSAGGIAGSPITITAQNPVGGGTLEWKAWAKLRTTSTWTLVRDYAASPVIPWTPTVAGDYDLMVYAREAGKTYVSYDVSKAGLTYTVVSAQANTPPTASFTIAPATGTTATAFAFDASACSDAQDAAAVLQVQWDWNGDGTYDTVYSTVKTAQHTFASAGTYPVRVRVKDSGGLTATATTSVRVDPVPSANTPVTLRLITSKARQPLTAQWMAFQDGNGPWRPLAMSQTVAGEYVGQVTDPAGRYAFAFAYGDAVYTRCATTSELTTMQVLFDEGFFYSTPITISGMATGIPAGKSVGVYLRFSSASVNNAAYSLGVVSGTSDLVATWGSSSSGVEKMVIERNYAATARAYRNFDFAGSEPFATTTPFSLSPASAYIAFNTATTRGVPVRASAQTGLYFSTTYRAVPTEKALPSDFYQIDAQGLPSSYSYSADVYKYLTFHTPGNKTINTDAPSLAASMTATITTPYQRPAVSWTPYTDAKAYRIDFAGHWRIDMSAKWADGVTSYTLPDFSAVPGWLSKWGYDGSASSSNMYAFTMNATLNEKMQCEVADTYIDGFEMTTVKTNLTVARSRALGGAADKNSPYLFRVAAPK